MRELLEKYRAGGLLVMLSVAIVFAAVQAVRIGFAKKDLVTAAARLEAAQERVGFRDAQIAALVADATARNRAADKALISAKTATTAAATRAQALQSEAVPVDCAAAVAWAAARGKSAGAW